MQFPASHTSGIFPRRSVQYYTKERLKKKDSTLWVSSTDVLNFHILRDIFMIRKIKCCGWDFNSWHITYIIQTLSTTITRLTRHTVIATLIEYIASERSTALKRKMFGVSDWGELGHLSELLVICPIEPMLNQLLTCEGLFYTLWTMYKSIFLQQIKILHIFRSLCIIQTFCLNFYVPNKVHLWWQNWFTDSIQYSKE